MFRSSPFSAGPLTACLLAWAAVTAGPAIAQVDDVESIRRLAAAGQAPAALNGVDRLLIAKPKDASLRFLKGVLLTDARRSADALQVFERLTEDFPDLPEPYNNLAVLYAGQGDFERARVALVAALRANPRYSVAQTNLGDVHLQLARQSYQRALELAPADASLPAKLTSLRALTDSYPLPAAAVPAR